MDESGSSQAAVRRTEQFDRVSMVPETQLESRVTPTCKADGVPKIKSIGASKERFGDFESCVRDINKDLNIYEINPQVDLSCGSLAKKRIWILGER